jgi:ribosome maturation factor RimP
MMGREAIEREVEARLADDLPEVDLLEVAVTGRGPSAALRAVIDHPAGVDHELCARVTKVLDRAGLLDRYAVEVSSPGPERPLRTLEHFEGAIGRRVQVRLAVSTPEGRRSRTGTLAAADAESLTLASPEGVVRVPMSDVRRANVRAGNAGSGT